MAIFILRSVPVFFAVSGLPHAQIISWDQALFGSSPPVYPSPETAGSGREIAYVRAEAFLANLTSNTGTLSGATVPQLYLSLPQIPNEDPTPLRGLRGFEKVSLQPGQSTTVTLDLRRRDFSYWSASSQEWVNPAGSIEILAGSSSRDIGLTTTIQLL